MVSIDKSSSRDFASKLWEYQWINLIISPLNHHKTKTFLMISGGKEVNLLKFA